MKKLIKQLFCRHEDITTKTESYTPDHVFIVKSIIQCNSCEKTFAMHPHAQCCHVQHIHSQIIYDYWVNKVKQGQQSN
jgi:hypothetical protein